MHRRGGSFLSESTQRTVDAVHACATIESQNCDVKSRGRRRGSRTACGGECCTRHDIQLSAFVRREARCNEKVVAGVGIAYIFV